MDYTVYSYRKTEASDSRPLKQLSQLEHGSDALSKVQISKCQNQPDSDHIQCPATVIPTASMAAWPDF